MTPPIPKRILFVRPDAYGDILLFDPVLRLLKKHWPDTEIGLLVQERYLDIAPLLAPDIRWIGMRCDPYRESISANPHASDALRQSVNHFAPDCVVAACADKTWIEAAVAHYAPGARRVSLGPYRLDPITEIVVRERAGIEGPTAFTEFVELDAAETEWERNLRLAEHLLGKKVPRQAPLAQVPEPEQLEAARFLAQAGIEDNGFVACCPAGTARVTLKAWPTAHYGEVLAWLQKTRNLRPLLLGHVSEAERIEEVGRLARAAGADPIIWMGNDGQFPLLGGLLNRGRLYFGNDTGAMHLAAALGKPLVSIFGGGHWPRFKPAAERAITIVQPLPCFGCGWNCLFGEALCVKTVPVAAAKNALQRVLRSPASGQEVMEIENVLSEAERKIISQTAEASRSSRRWTVVSPDRAPQPLRHADLVRLITQLEFSEADRAARLEVIHRQSREISKLEQDGRQWADQFARTEADRAARLEVSRQQAAEIQTLQEAVRDGAVRAAELERLREQVRAAEAEHVSWRHQAQQLREQLAGGRAENESRQRALDEMRTAMERLREASQQQAAQLAAHEADQAIRSEIARHQASEIERLREVSRLHDERVIENRRMQEQLQTIESDRRARQREWEELKDRLAKSEQDRAARLAVIERQGAELGRLQNELRIWFGEIRDLSLKAHEAERERTRLHRDLQALQAKVVENSRLTDQCSRQSQAIREFLSSQEAARARIQALQGRLSAIEDHWTIRCLKRLRLCPRL